MNDKVKTDIECYFLLPDFKSRGHPTLTIQKKFFKSIQAWRPWYELC